MGLNTRRYRLLSGDLAGLGDVLMQRWKAVQQAQVDGNWSAAAKLELTDPAIHGLVVPAERHAAIKELDFDTRLDERQSRASTRKRNRDRGGDGHF